MTSSKGRFPRLYLLKAMDLTLTNKIHQFPRNFLIETLTILKLSFIFVFTFDINFPKSYNINGEFCSTVNTIEFG